MAMPTEWQLGAAHGTHYPAGTRGDIQAVTNRPPGPGGRPPGRATAGHAGPPTRDPEPGRRGPPPPCQCAAAAPIVTAVALSDHVRGHWPLAWHDPCPCHWLGGPGSGYPATSGTPASLGRGCQGDSELPSQVTASPSGIGSESTWKCKLIQHPRAAGPCRGQYITAHWAFHAAIMPVMSLVISRSVGTSWYASVLVLY